MSRYLKLLERRIPRSNLESALSLSSTADGGLLDVSRAQIMAMEVPDDVPTRTFKDAQKRLLDSAPDALNRLETERSEKNLTPPERMSLEAIVRADGTRNGFYLQGDTIDADANKHRLADWFVRTKDAQGSIPTAASTVGRIDVIDNGEHFKIGTCFAISDNMIATNLHVLQALAVRHHGGSWIDWEPRYQQSLVNFSGEKDNEGTASFAIKKVAFAGPQPIGMIADPTKLDLAILEVAPINGASFPSALFFDASGASDGGKVKKDKDLYVIGFPINPKGESQSDLSIVFGGTFGVKQWSPGRVMEEPGTPADVNHWMFSHDASTLPGSSGSLILDFEDVTNPVAIGLHFAGESGQENNAHVMSELRPHLEKSGAVFL